MKKILVIGLEPFLPVKSGSRKVVFEYCKLLKSMGHELSFCNWWNTQFTQEFLDFFDNRVYAPKERARKYNWINKIRLRLISKHKQRTGYNWVDDIFILELQDYVRELNAKFHYDICIVNYITLSKVLVGLDVERKVLFTHDCFTNKNEILNTDSDVFNLTPNEEAKGIRRATDILSIQDNESVLFHYYNPSARIYTVYSFFPTTNQQLTGNDNILLFSGNNELNRNGADFFLTEVFPLVLKQYPSAKLVVGGALCNYLKEKTLHNVEMLGFVQDPADFYKLGDIAINPIYQGTGLKIKTFEALSFGKSVVVHPHSIVGMYKPYQSPLLVGFTPQLFANHIVNLLSDKNKRQQLAKTSVEYIEEMNQYIIEQFKKLTNF